MVAKPKLTVGEKYAGMYGTRAADGFGPGNLDYVDIHRFLPKSVRGDPVIDPSKMFEDFMTVPPNGPWAIDNLELGREPPSQEQIIPDRPGSAWWSQFAQNDDGTRNDAMPQYATPSTAGAKGNMEPPSTDPMAQLMEAFMGLFDGSTPQGQMGMGTTIAQKGNVDQAKSQYVQDPTAQDFGEVGPPAMAFPFIDMGPSEPMPDMPMAMGQMPPPPTRAPRPAAPAMGTPPVPTPNPNFHQAGGQDMRSIGAILAQMFGGGAPAGQPPVPQRNPLFTGGV